jgi:hypothetical protein
VVFNVWITSAAGSVRLVSAVIAPVSNLLLESPVPTWHPIHFEGPEAAATRFGLPFPALSLPEMFRQSGTLLSRNPTPHLRWHGAAVFAYEGVGSA